MGTGFSQILIFYLKMGNSRMIAGLLQDFSYTIRGRSTLGLLQNYYIIIIEF